MKNKVTYLISVLLLCFCLISCSNYGDKDGKIVKDADNNYYRLDHRIGVVYALEKINKTELDSLEAH